MLDLVKQETERIDSRFLEPACGNGNFLAEILRRKLAVVKSRYAKNPADYERYAVIAVTSIYGVDILADNVKACRRRLYKIFDREYKAICKEKVNEDTRKAVRYILRHNILCGDALKMKTAKRKPLVFVEWLESKVAGKIARRYFQFDHLLKANTENLQLDLFGKAGKYERDETGARVLKPIRELPPIHYRRFGDNE